MSGELTPPPRPAPGPLADGASATAGDRATVIVTPDQVWPAPGPPTPPGPEPAHRTFYAPLVLVTAVSAALVTAALAFLALLLWLRR